jgi:hypothetical protein
MRIKQLSLALAVSLGFLSIGSSARADCEGNICFPPHEVEHSYMVYIGTDPNWGNTQWVGWLNKDTFQCHWDPILDWGGNHATTIPFNMTVFGGWGDDTISIVPPSGITFCGFFITPPLYNGNKISLNGEAGADRLITYAGSGPGTLLSAAVIGVSGDSAWHFNWLVTYRADNDLWGNYGPDDIFIYGAGNAGSYYGQQGNDRILVNPSAVLTHTLWYGCHEGNDTWCGPASFPKPTDCEYTSTACNGW